MNENEFTEDFAKLLKNVSCMKTQLTEFNQNIKTLEKGIKKKMKQIDKILQKTKSKGNKKATGFAKPAYISKELCHFMKLKEGSIMARTDVTKYLIQYIKDQKLQDTNNKKVIKTDNKLKTLLNIKPTEQVTYFNLQKYMNKHFISPLKQ